MTRRQIERYVAAWVPRLGLERWKIKVDWDSPAEDEALATVTKSAYYDTASLRFAADFAKWSADDAEVTVVHELLHLCHRDVDEVLSDLDGQLHRDAAIMVERRYKQVMESFVDRLASRLVEIVG